MILTYTCIRKCYFREGIRNVGDKMILDSSVGDACPHLVCTPTEDQLAMQACSETTETKTKVSVPKAEAAVSSVPKKKSNGGKAQ